MTAPEPQAAHTDEGHDDLDVRVTCEGCGESHDHCTCTDEGLSENEIADWKREAALAAAEAERDGLRARVEALLSPENGARVYALRNGKWQAAVLVTSLRAALDSEADQ